MTSSESDFTSDLSAAAQAWVQKKKGRRKGRVATADQLRAAAGDDTTLLGALTAFEERYGGFVCDPSGWNLELGIGLLHERELEVTRTASLVLVGTEEHADLMLDAHGVLWASGSDHEPGEIATTLEKYIERQLVATAPKGCYVAHTAPLAREMIDALELAPDHDVSDATFMRAFADGVVVEQALRGTSLRTSSARLLAADFTTLVKSLRKVARLDGFRASIASGTPKLKQHNVDRAKAPAREDLERELGEHARLRIPTLDGGTIYVANDGAHIGMITLDHDGALRGKMVLEDGHGESVNYLPWPDA